MKILELEKGIGEKVSCNEIFGFIKSEDNKIQELLKSHGLNIMLNIKAASYSINYNLVFKPIRETTSSDLFAVRFSFQRKQLERRF